MHPIGPCPGCSPPVAITFDNQLLPWCRSTEYCGHGPVDALSIWT
jgi:hypothetical protein